MTYRQKLSHLQQPRQLDSTVAERVQSNRLRCRLAGFERSSEGLLWKHSKSQPETRNWGKCSWLIQTNDRSIWYDEGLHRQFVLVKYYGVPSIKIEKTIDFNIQSFNFSELLEIVRKAFKTNLLNDLIIICKLIMKRISKLWIELEIRACVKRKLKTLRLIFQLSDSSFPKG